MFCCTSCGSWSCKFRGAGRRKTGFAAVSIVFEALQAVYAVLRNFGGRAAAAPVVVLSRIESLCSEVWSQGEACEDIHGEADEGT